MQRSRSLLSECQMPTRKAAPGSSGDRGGRMFPRAAQAARDTPLPLTAPTNAVQQVMMQWHNIMHTGKQQMVCTPATAHQSLLWTIRSGLHVCVSGVHTDLCGQAGRQAHASCMRCNLFSNCHTWEMLWTAGSWAAEEGLCLMLCCLGVGLIPARPAKCYCWSSPSNRRLNISPRQT